MITDYDPTQGEDSNPTEPNSIAEFFNAKSYLQTVSKESGDNLYDHLRDLLNKILSERPDNIIDFFEEYSRKLKEERYKPMTDHLRDIYVIPGRLELATQIMPMLKPQTYNEPSTVDPEDLELADLSKCNMLELLYYLENCGISFPKSEIFFIMLSMKNLVHKEQISSIRFWGKIIGTIKNYLIIECELKEEEYIKRNEGYHQNKNEPDAPKNTEVNFDENEYTNALGDIARDQQFPGEGRGQYPRQLPPEPKIQYEEPPEPPSEPSGVGINKKVYYICNGIGQSWIQLPDVTPKQIRVARQIYKSFTGNLEELICTYPEFTGREKEYLRAQIARISAGTQIAPLGYYIFGGPQGGEGDEEEEDEAEEIPAGESKTSYRSNPKYEPPALKDLLDGSMSFWVHQTNYILPQGRSSWWDPNPIPDVQDEEMEEELGEEEEEHEKTKIERVEPETGPPLLTPLSEDTSLDVIPTWSVRSSSKVIDNFAVAVVRSNLWPGAYCFSTQGKFFQNIYIGFGLKQLGQNYSPTPLPLVQQEYPIGPEIMEMLDPSGIEEERWRIDHLPKPKALPVEDEAEESGGEEEVPEDEEDDIED